MAKKGSSRQRENTRRGQTSRRSGQRTERNIYDNARPESAVDEEGSGSDDEEQQSSGEEGKGSAVS